MRFTISIALLAAMVVPAVSAHAAPSNGRIMFSDISELFSVKPDGSDRQRVTDGWIHDWFAPSPDGRSLVSDGNEELVLSDASTGARIGSVPLPGKSWIGAPVWAPDGSEIAFQACDETEFTDIEDCVKYGVYRVRPDGSGLKRVTEGSSPTWSADGRSLVFVGRVRRYDSNGNECNGIFIARSDGSGRRRVFPRRRTCAFDAREPGLVSGGRRVVFTDHDSVWSVRRDGRALRRLVHVRRGYMWGSARLSPDRRRIVYAATHNGDRLRGIFVTSAQRGGRGRRVARAGYPNWFAWLPR
jgi:Tol biopolymer transport system component